MVTGGCGVHVLVAYDIRDNKTRQKIFAFLKERGIHTQLSLFECEMDGPLLEEVRLYMEERIDPATDSVLLYPLCRRCTRQVGILGQGLHIVKTDWVVV